LTVVLDFKGTYSEPAIREMRREAATILNSSGVRLGWTTKEEAAGNSYVDLVVMTLTGSCEFTPAPPRYDELGPLAVTRTINGEVQPFGEVDCDHVAHAARAAMNAGDYSRADLLIGRALGRVLAHELVHMLTKSGRHGREGVEKPALSGRQLISSYLPLSAFDIDRLRQQRGLR